MSDEEERVAEIIAAWYDRREQGQWQDPDDVVRAHPEAAEALRQHFAAQAIFDGLSRSVGQAAETPAFVGEFRVLREIGRGGMGIVYEAEQTTMRRRVALKVLSTNVTSTRTAVERFQREARAAGRLHHTNIVPVHSMGQDRGVWYYAMELVDGEPLDRIIDRVRTANAARAPGVPALLGGVPGTRAHFERIARVFAGVAEGLELAHAAGVLHRDVKPANLILDAEGTLLLMDFGLARVADETVATRTGELMGTPAYMSPEQVGGGGVDARSDVYSLGATLYEVLTLRPPLVADSVAEMLHQVRSASPPTPRRLDARIPRDLETIVLKAMEKDPARRYATASDMAHDLRRFAEGVPIAARRITRLERAWRTARRHPTVSALSVLAFLLAVGLAWMGLAAAETARRQRDAARLRLTVPALVDRAAALHAEGRTVEALAEVDAALRIDDDSFAAHSQKAAILSWVGRHADALPHAERAAALSPGLAQAHQDYGGALLLVGRLEESVREMRRAVGLDCGRFYSHHSLWDGLSALGRHDEALAACEAAFRYFPESATLARLKFSSLRSMRRLEEARAYVRSAVERKFRPGESLQFAYLCVMAGRIEDAKALLAAPPDHPDDGTEVRLHPWRIGVTEPLVNPFDTFACARVHAALGDREATLRWLLHAGRLGWRFPAVGPPEPELDAMAADPEIAAALATLYGR